METVQRFPFPRTMKDVRAFLGINGYYRSFIPQYASVATPLTDLTRCQNQQRWTEHQHVALHLESCVQNQYSRNLASRHSMFICWEGHLPLRRIIVVWSGWIVWRKTTHGLAGGVFSAAVPIQGGLSSRPQERKCRCTFPRKMRTNKFAAGEGGGSVKDWVPIHIYMQVVLR